VAQRPAGFGAAREVCEFILRHRPPAPGS
jgi:hypothetical protein